MKFYAFISLCLLFAFVACRSNKYLHKVSESVSETQSSASIYSKDSTSTTTSTRDSISNITSEKQYLRTTWYRPDGTIRKIQESGREAERTSVAVHDTGSSAVSVTEQKVDSTKKVNLKKLETEQLKSFSDSRPVQGNEWGWFAGAFVLIIVIFGYWEYKKVKN